MKLTVLTVATAALIAASPALAQTQKQSQPDSPGASSNAPGQKMQSDREKGKDSPGPGASSYAPGQKMQSDREKGKDSAGSGASGYAPGHSTTGSGSADTTPKSK
jgi:hypothetical protein